MWLFLINLDGASWLNTILFCVLKAVYGLLAIQLTQCKTDCILRAHRFVALLPIYCIKNIKTKEIEPYNNIYLG